MKLGLRDYAGFKIGIRGLQDLPYGGPTSKYHLIETSNNCRGSISEMIYEKFSRICRRSRNSWHLRRYPSFILIYLGGLVYFGGLVYLRGLGDLGKLVEFSQFLEKYSSLDMAGNYSLFITLTQILCRSDVRPVHMSFQKGDLPREMTLNVNQQGGQWLVVTFFAIIFWKIFIPSFVHLTCFECNVSHLVHHRKCKEWWVFINYCLFSFKIIMIV